MKKRVLSLFLAVVMIVLAIPAVILPTFAVTASYKTGFSDADIVAEYPNKALYPNGTKFEKFPAGWEIGVMSPTAWNADYFTANNANGNGEYFNAGGSSWMGNKQGGGFYFSSGQLVAPISYTGGKDSSGIFNKLEANVLVRYTAEYDGVVSIDVSKLNFLKTWNAVFCILVNGQPVGQFDTADFDYATGAGWFQPTATDSASAISDIKDVDVKKGDVIDFVFRGTGADQNTAGITFNYESCKRLCNDWAFTIAYSEAEDFTSEAAVQHVFDVYDYGKYYKGRGEYLKEYMGQSGVWTMGWIPVDYNLVDALNAGVGTDYSVENLDKLVTIGSNFTPYNTFNRNKNSDQNFYTSSSLGQNGLTSGASGAFLQASTTSSLQFCPGGYWSEADYKIQYNESTGKYELSTEKYATGKDDNLGFLRYMTSFPAVATLRYTAEYGGNVKIDLTGAFNYANVADLSYLFVYVNGVRVKVIKNTGSNAGKQTFNIVELTELKPGDTVDIMNVVDPRYGILMVTEEINSVDANGNVTGTVACPWYNAAFKEAGNWKTGGNGMDNGGRRGFSVTSITTTVTDPYYATSSTWNGTEAVASAVKNYANSQPIPLFRWYKMVDGVETHIDFGGALSEGCYAKINPVMAEAAGIDLENDKIETVLQKYIAFLATTYTINLRNNDWQYGTNNSANEFSPFVTYGFYHDKDIGLTANSKVGYQNEAQFFTSLRGLDDMVRTGWKKYKDKNVILDAGNGNAVISDNTLGKDVLVNFSTALSGYKGHTANNCAGATAQVGNQGIAYVRPNNAYTASETGGIGSFVYTVPNDGVLNVNFDKITLAENTKFTFGMTVNGKEVIAPTNYDAGSQGEVSQSFLDAFNAKFGTIHVKAGDKVYFNFARSSGGVVVAPVISVTVTSPKVTLDNTVNLSIADAYAVKVTAVPEDEDGKIEVLVDGEVVATLNKASKYTGVVKGGIKVNELTSSETATNGQDGTTISYQLRGEKGGYTVTTNVYTITTNKMLEYYERSSDATTAMLAKSIRSLAITAYHMFNDAKGSDFSAAEKNWIKCNGANNYSLAGLKTVDGNVVVDSKSGGVGGEFTDWDSGLTDRTLATLKGLTAEDSYLNYWYKTEGDDTKKYAKFNPVEGLSALVKGVDFGYADNIDFKAYDYVIAGANVNLGDKISLVLIIDAVQDADIWALKKGGYSIVATGDGVNVTADTFAGVTIGGKDYIGAIVDVPVSAYDKTLDIVLMDGEGAASATMKYSVKAWCVNKYVFGGSSYENYLVRAVYNLGVAAAAYNAAHPAN